MFGSIYSQYPDILLASLRQMNDRYQDAFPKLTGMRAEFAKLYLRIFGIPEVGFQVRGLHFRKTLDSIHNFSPKSIVDIGCGIGCYAFFLADKFPLARITGWDIDRDKIETAQHIQKENIIQNVDFTYGNILKQSQKTSRFDLVIIIDVLEHIENYKHALTNISEITNPGGFLYIHVPQPHQKRFFKQTLSWEHEDHVREGLTPFELTGVLESLGFSVLSMRHTFGFFGSLAWELNHLLLAKNQWLAALVYPFLYMGVLLDGVFLNKHGLCMAVLAQKHG